MNAPAALLALALLSSAALAVPPKVIRAVPDNADLGVDPALKTITIEFDQDMDSRGHSICGGGPAFPKLDGDVKWADARTIVVPVKLEPGKRYTLGINCPAARNFKNTKGDSADNYPISFFTRKQGEEAPSLDEAAAKSALETLRNAIDQRYSYRDLRNVDWNDVFNRLGPAVESARTPSALARAAAKLLEPAKDMHINVRVGQFTLATHRPGVRANVNAAQLPQHITGWNSLNPRLASGSYDGIPYLLISDWLGAAEEYKPALEWVKSNASAPAIIIDVRQNIGGDELVARQVASRFVVGPKIVYSKNKSRDPSADGGWSNVYTREVESAKGEKPYAGKVAVLMGKACMSSNESFLLMMRHSGSNVKLIGESSYGSSGNPRPVDLGGGVTVVLPTWYDMFPDGSCLEGKGVQPDLALEWNPGDTDPILEAAAKWLKEASKTDKEPASR